MELGERERAALEWAYVQAQRACTGQVHHIRTARGQASTRDDGFVKLCQASLAQKRMHRATLARMLGR